MAENRRFYYLKLKEGFYNSETMVVLESMPDGLLYSNLLLKMYLRSCIHKRLSKVWKWEILTIASAEEREIS